MFEIGSLEFKAYAKLTRYLPARMAARLDFLIPQLRDCWGGPLNGQEKRRQMFVQILRSLTWQAIVETGTYRAVTTEFLRSTSELPVYSIETNPRFYRYSSLRLRADPEARILLGDSRLRLEQLAGAETFPKERVLFYLDAHWGGHLPLRDEVSFITQHWHDVAIVIDDFEVPDDPAYGFDRYEDGSELRVEYLDVHETLGLQVFRPSAPGAEETGERRGCVVLATQGLVAGKLSGLDTVRPG